MKPRLAAVTADHEPKRNIDQEVKVTHGSGLQMTSTKKRGYQK